MKNKHNVLKPSAHNNQRNHIKDDNNSNMYSKRILPYRVQKTNNYSQFICPFINNSTVVIESAIYKMSGKIGKIWKNCCIFVEKVEL